MIQVIDYVNADGEEVSFSADVPDVLYIQLTKHYGDFALQNPGVVSWAARSLSEYTPDEDPKDHYQYFEYETSTNPLLGYFMSRKWSDDEPEAEFHDITTNYDIRVTLDEDDTIILNLARHDKIVAAPEPDEYIPPIEE